MWYNTRRIKENFEAYNKDDMFSHHKGKPKLNIAKVRLVIFDFITVIPGGLAFWPYNLHT